MEFREWLHHPSRTFNGMWEVNPENQKIIGLGRGFLQLIHGVIIYLIALHEQNDFNGNLLQNMRISRKNVVSGSYWDLEFRINRPPNLSLIKGIVADVQHLRSMVYLAAKRFSLKDCPALCLFLNQFYGFEESHFSDDLSSLSYVKKIAYFNYSHPLFFNDVNMAHFIYKVYEVRKRNVSEFNRLIRLNDSIPIANMTGWLARIPVKLNMWPCHDMQSPLRQVLYYRQGQHPYAFRNYFNCSNEVVTYLRSVCEHGRDVNTKESSGRILKELHQVLPDALSKIHFLLHVKFSDYICRKHFNANNIVDLMTNDHFGYKGSFESIVQITSSWHVKPSFDDKKRKTLLR
ncbi:hypothetical protein LOK49_LG07G00176 [Camellia lanceoleosa]|uniref:Uncharacterized protein n=1 Tax=Camellia lanceoleosa TaxID=1840588 RepID=A0ACC0GYV7_9ERIC|nr:hypothetical protein LOK49_LG07G00176 [Camellia lanceoleosa]